MHRTARRPHSRAAALSLAALLAACSAAPTTSAVDAASADTFTPDASGPVYDSGVTEPLRVQTAFDAPSRAPSLGCVGRFDRPPPPVVGSTLQLEVRDFQLEATVPRLTLRARFGDAALGDCVAPRCLSATTDAQGLVTLAVIPGANLGLELLPERRGDNDSLNPTRTLALDVALPTGGAALRVWSISEATRKYMPQSAGLTVNAAEAQGMGVARDCAGEPLGGAVIRAFDEAGAEVTLSSTGPGVAYTNVVHRPDRAQRSTNFNGQFVLVNLPPGRAYRVEAWGTPPGERAPRRVACAVVPTWSESVTWRDLTPPPRPSATDPCAERLVGP